MENLIGHETGNSGYSQGNTYGNSPSLDPTFSSDIIDNHVKRYVSIIDNTAPLKSTL
jgi:hypothetical protein